MGCFMRGVGCLSAIFPRKGGYDAAFVSDFAYLKLKICQLLNDLIHKNVKFARKTIKTCKKLSKSFYKSIDL